MRAEVEVPYSSLQSTIYRQSLPVPRRPQRTIAFRGTKKTGSNSKKNEPPKVWAFQKLNAEKHMKQKGHSSSHWSGTTLPEQWSLMSHNSPVYTGLDQNTMHWKSWVSHKEEDYDTNHKDLSMYKITQDVFRKLTIQVKEANQRAISFNGSGFKTYQRIGDRRNVPVVKPSQLASNLQAYSPSVSIATDYDPNKISDTLITKPVAKSRRPHSTSVSSHRQRIKFINRPHSTTGTRLSNNKNSEADSLTPNIIGALSKGEIKKHETDFPGPFDIVAQNSRPYELEKFTDYELDCDVDKELENLEYLPEDVDSAKQVVPEKEMINEEKLKKFLDYDDEEVILEEQQRWAAMKPEKVDEEEIMFDYRGFSAPYRPQENFAEVLSQPFCHMDLLDLSLLEKDWRTVVSEMPGDDEFAIIKRLIEMARAQFDTEKWENKAVEPKKAISTLQEMNGWNADAALPTERARSAMARPKPNRNCSESCLKVLCAGECQNKKSQTNTNACVHCQQLYCNGSCTEYGYHLYIRQPKKEDEILLQKSCKSCRKSSKMNIINSNNVLLGRPKSAYATFTSTKHQSAKAKTEKSVETSSEQRVLSATNRLDLKKPRQPSAGKKRPHSKGRNGMIPGKSFYSQRKNSLTDEPISTSAAKMNSRILNNKRLSRPKSVNF